MRKFFIIMIVFSIILSIYDLINEDKFKDGRQQVYYSYQCSNAIDSKEEVIKCKDGKQYRKAGNQLILIE